MRAGMLFAVRWIAVIAALAVSGCAASVGVPRSTEAGCAAAAIAAIRAHERLTGAPAACHGLGRSQIDAAASVAIRIASGHGSKSAWRRRAGVAAGYVSVLITSPVPAASASADSGGGGGVQTAAAGSRLGFSELAVQVAALLAWMAAAGSGGWVLVGWWRMGGGLSRPRRRTDTNAPPAVIIAHVGLGLLGLLLWGLFMITGQAALAWACVGLLVPVAGLGLCLLVLGLPSPRPLGPQLSGQLMRTGGRQPVLTIAAHGLFAMVALLMAVLAVIGAA
jgi:hypothetical protein